MIALLMDQKRVLIWLRRPLPDSLQKPLKSIISPPPMTLFLRTMAKLQFLLLDPKQSGKDESQCNNNKQIINIIKKWDQVGNRKL
eukprot:13768122-Ditylum_brightwellii.AAC.1